MYKWICNLLLLTAGLLGLGGKGLAQSEEYQFVRYSAEKGLSHNRVNCFFKDRKGFVWIGTSGGLNRFDGYTFKIFKHEARDSATIADDQIDDLFEDSEGYLWINTRLGFNIYDPVTERVEKAGKKAAQRLGLPDADFSRIIKTKAGDYWIYHNGLGLVKYLTAVKKLVRIKTLSKAKISDFNEDAAGHLWIVYEDGSLLRLDTETYKTSYHNTMFTGENLEKSLNHRVFVDEDNEPWVYTVKAVRGLFYFDLKRGQLTPVSTSSSFIKLNNNIISSVIQGPDGRIWVGTDHGGINILDKKNRSASLLLYNRNDPRSISQNSITTLYKDVTGMIWAGTFKNGFSNYHKNIFKFSLIRHQPADPSSLPFDDVNVFAEDRKGNIWVGSNGGGLIYLDRKNQTFRQYKNIPGDPSSLSNDVIVSMFMDQSGILWIGTYFGGLNSFDGRKFTRYLHSPSVPASLIDDRVWEIYEDSKQRLWVGTLANGMDLLDRKLNLFSHYRPGDPNSISSDYVAAILEDKEGDLWIGTAYGIDVLKRSTGKFIHYVHDNKNPKSLSSDGVTSLAEDRFGNIWIGTAEGLNIFDKKTGFFTSYDARDGLPDNSILTVVIDARENLWLGTPKGLVNFKITKRKGRLPSNFAIRTYNEVDGLQGRSFNENAALRLRSGELIFGGANGFSIFSPDALEGESGNSSLVLTDFQIFNKSIKPGELADGKPVLEKSISETDQLTLTHRQNVFTIEFAALNFLHADKNHYLYTLQGFNDQWFEADNNTRKVTYTNLDPGDYIFKVRIKDNQSHEGERMLRITILPPFWKTPLAYILYVLLFLGALAIARWILLERERMNFKLEQERREAQQMHDFDMMKIKFFTNVSHEFRTPLTLILTPLESLINSLPAENSVRNQLLLMYRNAGRLLNLVTQLLDFKKLEVEETRFTPERSDIIQFVRDITYTFSDFSERKHIDFSFNSTVESRYCLFDPEKLSRIMYNLLSNAFKFTPEYGRISVEIALEGTEQIGIRVIDSGIGIPQEAQQKVFDRFYQHSLPDHIANQGSGIGLSITKEFVKLHGGSISVESVEGEGSVFTIILPLKDGQESLYSREPEQKVLRKEEVVAPEVLQESVKKEKPVLLLVEDNDEFRAYLTDVLRKDYRIFEAPNGRAGLDMVLDTIPDLVVSDVMMPEMDGMELCRRIKSDHRISYIPVILLTARAEDEQQLQGYETGADAYVTKPFRLDILQVRIKNLIRQRELFRRQFQKHIDIQPAEVASQSQDEQFISKAVKAVEQNMANPDFTVEDLSAEMAMSRVYLYKKLLSLTGKTPIEFIRIIRLRRSVQLLEKSQLTISEIAYQVGFNNPKYFAKLFKEEYKVLPSDFRKKEVASE
jgi:signal transduction histidine kinase/ligand-binding sensor domain-containing protein/DNA-binding response OmpR family regulator